MSRYASKIAPYVAAELALAREAELAGRHDDGFRHLERAHVLGQASTAHHVRVHWRMLCWGLRHRQAGEVAGQLLRLVGAITKTAIGLLPEGNTGGANVSAVKPMPVPEDLAEILRSARA
ncbi:MAG: DUF3703 domain-containing protein [Gammaproteobacteria bacterium]|nr:DUF3703 domain-containing protein [Gammaproteobacteria bacterium]